MVSTPRPRMLPSPSPLPPSPVQSAQHRARSPGARGRAGNSERPSLCKLARCICFSSRLSNQRPMEPKLTIGTRQACSDAPTVYGPATQKFRRVIWGAGTEGDFPASIRSGAGSGLSLRPLAPVVHPLPRFAAETYPPPLRWCGRPGYLPGDSLGPREVLVDTFPAPRGPETYPDPPPRGPPERYPGRPPQRGVGGYISVAHPLPRGLLHGLHGSP